MDAAQWGIVGTVGGALLGLAVGKLWDRADERRRWLRDRKMEAYVDHIDKFQQLRPIMHRLATLEDRTDWEKEKSGRRPAWGAYNASFVRLELLGTARSYKSARIVDSHLRDISVVLSKGRMSVEDWHRERQLLDLAMRSHIDNVRRELKLSGLGDRSDWVGAAPGKSEPSWGESEVA